MTQSLDAVDTPAAPAPAPRRPRRTWVGFAVLAVLAAAFLTYQVPPYFSLDPANSRIPLQFPWHWFLLAGHVITGSIALVTMVLQVWPWLRRTHPAVHRASGRLYLFGGALPSAFFAIAMFPVAFKAGSIAVLMSSALWALTAVIGWRRARQRRYVEHRRWMLYSFAIMWGQVVWGFIVGMTLFMLPLGIEVSYITETARWVCWVGNLIAVHWWLERRAGRNLGGASIADGSVPPREQALVALR